MLFSLVRGQMSFENALIQIAVILVIIFLILPFHEWAHAFTAYKLGDKQIKYSGRLTLNPLAHIDIFGSLCLLLFNFGWAKPVPINSRDFKYPRTFMAITAFMGPFANVLAALVGSLIYYAVAAFGGASVINSTFGIYFTYFISVYIQLNCFLAAFNIIPIPPLDGSKVLFAFLPDKWLFAIQKYSMYFFIIIYLLLWTGILSVPLGFISNALINFVNFLGRLPFSALL